MGHNMVPKYTNIVISVLTSYKTLKVILNESLPLAANPHALSDPLKACKPYRVEAYVGPVAQW